MNSVNNILIIIIIVFIMQIFYKEKITSKVGGAARKKCETAVKTFGKTAANCSHFLRFLCYSQIYSMPERVARLAAAEQGCQLVNLLAARAAHLT